MNWAIVIGIDRYQRPEDRLRAAVRDADQMSQWLLDPAGGNVPKQNLTLLLEPDAIQPTVNVAYGAAGHDDIVLAIEKLLARSGGKGERFYFYFAGHGLSAPINFSYPSAILSRDFDPLLPHNSFTLPSLYELFQGTEFKEQFFFVDACRNLAFDSDKRLTDYPNPRKPIPPVSPQYIMYATQPGVKSIEVQVPGNEQGVFTRTLLEGLKGSGGAKRWDPQEGDYAVRWGTLFTHVESTIVAMKLIASNGPKPLIQEPRQLGERDGRDPVLARFAENLFGTEDLDVTVTPATAAATASVVIGEMGRAPTDYPPPLPTTLSVPPRAYWVDAKATGYRTKGRAPVVELYSRGAVVVPLEPAPPAAPPAAVTAAPAPAPATSPQIAGGTGGRGIATGPAAPAVRRLRVSNVDSLARLEIAGESGQVLVSGRQQVEVIAKPGLYRARLLTPEGTSTEELVYVSPGAGDVTVQLNTPTPVTPAMQWVMSEGQFVPDLNGMLMPSESVGSAEYLKLSTMLALAAGARVETVSGFGDKLRQLPVEGFRTLAPGADCGIQIVIGDERMELASWADAATACWPIDSSRDSLDAQHADTFSGDGARTAALTPQPGAYWLELSLNERSRIVLPVIVSPHRLTLIVVTRELNDAIELHHYQLALQADPQLNGWDRDPYFSGSQFAALRRIELMQRSAARGQVTPSLPDIDILLDQKWLDPLAGCLGGYLLLRLGRARDLAVAAENLTRFFGELPDAWILLGEYRRSSGGEAYEAYLKALDCGMPLFRDGIALLHEAIVEMGLSHPRTDLVRRALECIPVGSLWATGDETLAAITVGDLVYEGTTP